MIGYILLKDYYFCKKHKKQTLSTNFHVCCYLNLLRGEI